MLFHLETLARQKITHVWASLLAKQACHLLAPALRFRIACARRIIMSHNLVIGFDLRLLGAGIIAVFLEDNRQWQAWLRLRILGGIAKAKAKHRIYIFREIKQGCRPRRIIADRPNIANAKTGRFGRNAKILRIDCLLYTSPSPRDGLLSRMPSSA